MKGKAMGTFIPYALGYKSIDYHQLDSCGSINREGSAF